MRSALCRTRTRTRRAANRHRVRSPRYVCGPEGVAFHPQSAHPGGFSQADAPALLGPFLLLRFSVPVAIRLRLSRQLRAVFTPVFTCPASSLLSRAPTRPPLPPPSIDKEASIYRVRKLLDVRPRGRGHSFGGLGGGTVLRRGVGFRPGTSWIARWSRTSTVLVRLLSLERLVALVERGGTVMIWVCLFFSLSHTLLYTHSHTHTHMHTDTYISLSLTCLSFQSAFALLAVPPVSHSSNQSLYLQRLRSRLSAGLLYVMHSCVSLPILEFSFVPCLVPPGDAEGFWLLLGVLLPHPFCVYDRLPCFALLLKTVLTILCVWILTFPFVTETARSERLFMIFLDYNKISGWIFTITGWLFSHSEDTQLCSNTLLGLSNWLKTKFEFVY